MKNFDEDRAARRNVQGEQFVLSGETFTVETHVNPNVLLAFDAIDEPGTGIGKSIETIDKTIKAMIVDVDGTLEGGHARYDALRQKDGEDLLTIGDLIDLASWLIGAQAGRPTGQSSASATGRGTTGTTSTGASSSPETREGLAV